MQTKTLRPISKRVTLQPADKAVARSVATTEGGAHEPSPAPSPGREEPQNRAGAAAGSLAPGAHLVGADANADATLDPAQGAFEGQGGGNITEIRRANFLLLLQEHRAALVRCGKRPTDADFARKINVRSPYLGHVRARRRNIGHNLSRKIEVALGLPVNWLDSAHEQVLSALTPQPERNPALPPKAVPRTEADSVELLFLEHFTGDAGLLRLAELLRRLAGENYHHEHDDAAARVRNAARVLVAGKT